LVSVVVTAEAEQTMDNALLTGVGRRAMAMK
jgi:hypothetical protein